MEVCLAIQQPGTCWPALLPATQLPLQHVRQAPLLQAKYFFMDSLLIKRMLSPLDKTSPSMMQDDDTKRDRV